MSKLPSRRLQREVLYRSVIERLATDSSFSATSAAKMLQLSTRQVFRLKAKCRILGLDAVSHGNRGRPSPRAIPESLHRRVVELYRSEFKDLNTSYTLFAEILEDEYAVPLPIETVRRWLIAADLGHKPRRGRRHRRFRLRSACLGDMLFLDGSPHRWFGPDSPRVTLILASDDATGQPLYGLFEAQESLNGCFNTLYHVALRYGLPGCLYLDRAGQFTTTRHEGLHRYQCDDQPTAFEIAMNRLGIELIYAHTPQARGRGERLNQSFQGRLVVELHRAGINDCQPATNYLNQQFIPRYIRRFGVKPRDPKSGFRPVPAGIDLKRILCREHRRTVNSDHTIMLHGFRYQLYPSPGTRSLYSTRVTVQEWFDGTVHVMHQHLGEIRCVLIPSHGVIRAAARPRQRHP